MGYKLDGLLQRAREFHEYSLENSWQHFETKRSLPNVGTAKEALNHKAVIEDAEINSVEGTVWDEDGGYGKATFLYLRLKGYVPKFLRRSKNFDVLCPIDWIFLQEDNELAQEIKEIRQGNRKISLH